MNKRVVITGLGVVSSIGIGWKEFWNSLLNGKSGIGPVTSFDTSGHFTHNGGEVKDFYPDRFINVNKVNFMSRAIQFASRPQDLRWKMQIFPAALVVICSLVLVWAQLWDLYRMWKL